MKINLGSGNKPMAGWINVDGQASVSPDVVWDLNVIPYPFESECADEIRMDQVLEHLNSIVGPVCEIHRLLKPGGKAVISVPYVKTEAAFYDPTHRQFFTERSLAYFQSGHTGNFYCGAQFSSVTAELLTNKDLLRHRIRNVIPRPVRSGLRFLLWNMFDGLEFVLVK